MYVKPVIIPKNILKNNIKSQKSFMYDEIRTKTGKRIEFTIKISLYPTKSARAFIKIFKFLNK